MVMYSHSRISTFEQCPLKYKFRYIDKLEPDIKQTIEGFLGNQVHKALEWVYNQVILGVPPELDSVIGIFAKNWKENYGKDIKIVSETLNEENYFNKGIKFLIDYFNKYYPFKDDTIATEKKVIFYLDAMGRYQLQGYVDRMVHDKEKNIFEIHDYKTGSIKTQEELDKDRQLALYSMWVKENFKDIKEVILVWHFLDYDIRMTSKRTDNQLNDLKEKIISIINKIESERDYLANPGCLCKWCEFRSYCKFKDGCSS